MGEFHSGSAYRAETDGMEGFEARKAPVPQESILMANAATVRTKEGPLAYAEGWVLTADVKGNLYGFDQDYLRANMDVEGSPSPVPVPDGIAGIDALRSAAAAAGVAPFVIRKKQQGLAPVRAYRMGEPFSVATSWGETMQGQAGGYLVEEDRTGACNRWVVDVEVFEETYLR